MPDSLPEHVSTPNETALDQHRTFLPSDQGSESRYHIRSHTQPPHFATTRQPQLTAPPTTSAAPVQITTTQDSVTDRPVKRRRGRPRKHPLPDPPREPSPNPVNNLGRAALVQLVSGVRQGRELSDEQTGQLSRLRPRHLAGATSTAAEDAMQQPTATPQARTLTPYHVTDTLAMQLPNDIPVSEAARRHITSLPAAPTPLPTTTGAPIPAQIPVHYRPVPPTPLHPPIPDAAADQTAFQLSANSLLQWSATLNAPAASADTFNFSTAQPSLQFPTIAPTHPPPTADAAVATLTSLHFSAAPQAPVGFPSLARGSATEAQKAFQVDILPPAADLATQASPLCLSAPAESQALQAGYVGSPTPPLPTRNPREPEDVTLALQPDPAHPHSIASDVVSRALAAGLGRQGRHGVPPMKHERYEDQVAHDLAVVYQTHNPWIKNQDMRHHLGRLTITPRVDSYPFTYDNMSTDEMTVQPHQPPKTRPAFPLYAYWGRDLNEGPGFPTMTVSGGPSMPCFERSQDGDRADVGFGPGTRIAEAFRRNGKIMGGRYTEDVAGIDKSV